ncbi:MAG: hypothetical protein CMH53_00105 [Myxococcales bacterium]|nr:hypothetical protein [Myxococcales bacterium]
MASAPARLPEILFSRTDAEAAMVDAKTIAAELIDLARERGMHPVAVFDIDETLLLNHEEDDDLVAANPPVAALHAWLREEKGVTIYVVTARRWTEWSRKFAELQLATLGYPAPAELFMVNREHDDDPSASLFKLEARRKIAAGATSGRPHAVILNVGDQASDMMLMEPYSTYNAKFARRNLDPGAYHAIAHADGVSKVGLKLPERYTVE